MEYQLSGLKGKVKLTGKKDHRYHRLTLVLLNSDYSYFENSVDPDQLASDEAIWSGFTLFSMHSD